MSVFSEHLKQAVESYSHFAGSSSLSRQEFERSRCAQTCTLARQQSRIESPRCAKRLALVNKAELRALDVRKRLVLSSRLYLANEVELRALDAHKRLALPSRLYLANNTELRALNAHKRLALSSRLYLANKAELRALDARIRLALSKRSNPNLSGRHLLHLPLDVCQSSATDSISRARVLGSGQR